MPVLVAGGGGAGAGLNPVLVAGGPLFNQGGIGYSGAKLSTLPAAEEIDGYKEDWRNDGAQSVTRVFKVPWGNRWTWRDQMLGYSYTVPGDVDANGNPSGPGVLSRTIPDQVPEVGGQHLYCSELRMTGGKGIWLNNPNVFATNDGVPAGPVLVAGGPGGPVLAPGLGFAPPAQVQAPMIAYFDPVTLKDGLAIFEAVYTPRNYEVRTDAGLAGTPTGSEMERYVEFEISSAIQAIPIPTQPGKSLQWISPPYPTAGVTVPDNASFKYIHTQAFQYTWNEVPDYPGLAIGACTGGVNKAPFDGCRGRYTYAPQTCLCQAPLRVVRYRHTTGRIYWRITYSILFRYFTNPAVLNTDGSLKIMGWNALPDASGLFWPVGFPNNVPLYPEVDFTQLFAPPPPVTYQ